MKIAALADVKARLSAYVDEAETEGPIIITRNGKAVALLLAPKDDADLERLILAHSPRFQALLSEARQSVQAGQGVPHTEFWRTVRQEHQDKPASKPKK